MTDRYTKIVLTVIAGALLMLVAQNAAPRATAQNGDCGAIFRPCYVKNSASDELYVTGTVRTVP